MNTTKIGDKFENECYKLIKQLIDKGELGVKKEIAKIYRKKGYYSKDREKNIVFDLSIEIWPKNAKRYSLLFLIECKSSPSGHNVPVDDVEEFYTKASQVSGMNTKGIIITENSFQNGGKKFGKNKGLMMIESVKEENYTITYNKSIKNILEVDNLENKILKSLKIAFNKSKISGIKKLSSKNIENIANEIRNKLGFINLPIQLEALIDALKKEYDLKVDISNYIKTNGDEEILGFYDNEDKIIYINKKLYNSPRFPFVLGHEIGHFILHQKVKINNELYKNFGDTSFNFRINKHELKNPKNWIEWQANKFSVSFFLPKNLLLDRMVWYREKLGIRKPYSIYLDEQKTNIKDFNRTINHLSIYFNISKEVVINRLNELDVITNDLPEKRLNEIINKIINSI